MSVRALRPTALLLAVLLVSVFLGMTRPANAFTFLTAGGTNPVDTIVHPGEYYFQGGGVVTVTVGIATGTPNAADMMIPTQNAVTQWNWLTATTGNLRTGASSSVPAGLYDYESVLVHELGHALGLDHPNLASESGLPLPDQDYSRTTTGANLTFDLDPGADGIEGSADDLRGDDVNLGWFKAGVNNPLQLPASGIYDATTFSQDLADLPVGDNFVANADRAVANALGYANTEAVMQQGVATGEEQRRLTADDVAGIRFGMSGTDEIQGTADDYVIDLQFIGETTSADILISFNNASTPFAQTNSFILINMPDNHKANLLPKILFNDANQNWHFNQTPLTALPGDLTLDGDVDATDVLTMFANFTGPGTFNVTRQDGDVSPTPRDFDVDTDDILSAFASFTGPLDEGAFSPPAAAGDPAIPDLIYNAVTGEVILDPDGGLIRGYSLKSGNAFLPGGFTPVLGGVSVGMAAELSEAVFESGDEGISVAASIGNVFPTGLDLAGLTSLLTEFEASVLLGAELVSFDLVVLASVPEPSTGLLAAMAGLALVALGRFRQKKGGHRDAKKTLKIGEIQGTRGYTRPTTI
ncbi:MAG: hypothetical protein DWQ31_21200 [Planctomycetota bacterium]|nr:MAG: hypothetical protein DWQ31_21200 [Planctomycetota bacterium]REJ91216.1 MAG: hypothetical protein DWQ35_15135 [Planctomycetota bacterium]REK22217.1 MAG: hypothetical protein DWQ42_17840 [Planctomycetota bacterium]